MNCGARWIRTTEGFPADLQSAPFGHSGIAPKKKVKTED